MNVIDYTQEVNMNGWGTIQRCSTPRVEAELDAADPDRVKRKEDYEKQIKKWILENYGPSRNPYQPKTRHINIGRFGLPFDSRGGGGKTG